MTPLPRRRRGASRYDAAAAEWVARLRTGPGDGATWQFEGASGLGVMPPGGDTQPLPLPAPAWPEPAYRPAPAAPPERAVEHIEPAVIGDQIRLPVTWCDMPGCISWHRDPAAAGYCDDRDRAMAAGWRADAWGRLACPQCQQSSPGYRNPAPVAWHHPELERRWHCGEPAGGQAAFRLGAAAEWSRLAERDDPALFADVDAATRRAAAGRHHRPQVTR